MTKLAILSKQAETYRDLILAAQLPGLDGICLQADSTCEIALGEPNLLAPALSELTALQWAQATWAGVEPLLNPALRRNYTLTNARGVFGGLMSEYVLAYLLLHERKTLQRLENQRQQRWDATLTGSLRGKTLGLLGVGSIGAEIARAAQFFGMKVKGYTAQSETCPHIDAYFHPPHLLPFAAGLDYLVSVLPNTPSTRRIVDSTLLAALPPAALFINVGRGPAVDESALLGALHSGHLAGAVLDVFEQEPLPAAHPLWSAPNVIITSHTSAPSLPADLAALFIQNYLRWHSGQPLQWVVNFERGY